MGQITKTTAEVETDMLEGLDNQPKGNIVWDDLSGGLLAARLDTTSGRLDYDYFNAGVNFNSNARYPNEPVVIATQAKHAMLYGAGAVARPHFHRLQEQSDVPNFVLGYKLTNYGDITTKETDRSNYIFAKRDSNTFLYTSGALAQITKFPEVDISSLTISGSIDYVLFRDTTDALGLFGAVDSVGSDVTVKFNDAHYKFNQMGSRQEFVK